MYIEFFRHSGILQVELHSEESETFPPNTQRLLEHEGLELHTTGSTTTTTPTVENAEDLVETMLVVGAGYICGPHSTALDTDSEAYETLYESLDRRRGIVLK